MIEVVEISRDDQKFIRVNAIRETTELQMHEFDKNGKSVMDYINSTRGTTFRWPFYAKILAKNRISFMFMHKPLVSINYKHDEARLGSIERICFSNRGNLIMQCHNQDEVIYCRLMVKRDLDEDRGWKYKKDKARSSVMTQQM